MEAYAKPGSATGRTSAWGVQPLILDRWSPRAFLDRPIAERDLLGILEAAHWAPSCFNEQPWRFIVARTENDRRQLSACLTPQNQVWAGRAPVLLVVLSSPNFTETGKPNRWHAFDAGTAWGYLALEASARGLNAHAMGGFSQDKIRALYGVPEGWGIHAVVAVGHHGPKESLPEDLRDRELPSGRKPLNECWAEAKFAF
ncbi:MAG: nitroreductase family protein [candidate division FCPU426 bacterium]